MDRAEGNSSVGVVKVITSAQESKVKTLLRSLFNTSIPIYERINSGTELCGLLENPPPDDELRKSSIELFDALNNLLYETEVQFIKESPQNRLRHVVLEIMFKLRTIDFYRLHIPNALRLLFHVVQHDNEDNVLLCVKLVMELHKMYRPPFSEQVNHFLDFIHRMYRNLRNQAQNIFKPDPVYEVASLKELKVDLILPGLFSMLPVKVKRPGPGAVTVCHILPRGSLSLKVMQEIPILVVLLYQLFKSSINHHVIDSIPTIMEFINLRPPFEQLQTDAYKKSKYLDFMAAQVKTLSFLAYVMKIYGAVIEQHSVALVKGMMNLMHTCPPTVTNMRKEFFIATRHILSSQELRIKFLPVVDEMMEDNISIGRGYTVRDYLRPLSYSTLADLVHHLRDDLTISKIAKAIDLFTHNFFDDSLPFSIQQVSQRVFFNLSDCLRLRSSELGTQHHAVEQQHPNRRQIPAGNARRILFHILYVCVLKCRILAERHIPELEARCVKEESKGATEIKTHVKDEQITSDVASTLETKKEIVLVSEASLIPHVSLSDVKSCIKTLIPGIRSIVKSLCQCPHRSDSEDSGLIIGDAMPSAPNQLTPAEVAVLSDYLTYGLRLVEVFRIVSKDDQLYIRNSNSGMKYQEERSTLEHLAMAFVPVSSTSFNEIFTPKTEYIIEWCRRNPFLHPNFAYQILSQASQTSNFSNILLSYMVERLDKVGGGTDLSGIYMRLLKLCFQAVNMSGTDNEYIMKMHLQKIVQGSMRCCMEAREPFAYLSLLRALFRSIGGGAHDKLYQEFFPLLPEMLITLNRLLRASHRTHIRDLLGELCVIVPVRLSALMPYLTLLMEPITYVISSNTVSQGLRTMELCVDNMSADFLYQHLYQVRGDMLMGLYTSMHSQSEHIQKMACKVLGKLGRFNRADISSVQRLNLSANCGESGPLLRFWLHEFPTHPVDIPIRSLVDFAVESIQEPAVDHLCRLRAWHFLRGICVSSLGLQSSSQTIAGFMSGVFFESLPPYPVHRLCEVIRKASRITQPSLFDDKPSIYHLVMVRVVGGVFLSTCINPPIADCGSFMTFLVRHLTLIGLLEEPRTHFDPVPGKGQPLDCRVLIEAICFIFGFEDKEMVRPGCLLLDELIKSATAFINAALSAEGLIQNSPGDILIRLPMMRYLVKAVTNMLYHPAWYVKWGGCSILLHLCDRLPVTWFREHLLVFLRGLLLALHDLTNQLGQGALALAQQCSKSIVQLVFTAEAAATGAASIPTSSSGAGQVIDPCFKRASAGKRRRGGAGGAIVSSGKKRTPGSRLKDESDSPIQQLMEEVEFMDMSTGPSEAISQTSLMTTVLPELVESLLSETKVVRVHVRTLLATIAECLSIPLSTLLKPHIHLIDSWLPPKQKYQRLSSLPTSTQIAVLETNYFLCREAPEGAGVLHYSPANRRCDNRFLADLRAIAEEALPQLPLIPQITAGAPAGRVSQSQQTVYSTLHLQMAIELKIVAAQVLSTMHYIETQKSVILAALFKGVCSDNAAVHVPVFECTQYFVQHSSIDSELRSAFVKPILPNFRQPGTIRLANLRQLAYCAELFPCTFSERFCETIYSFLNNLVNTNSANVITKSLDLIVALIGLFPLIPLAGEKYVKPLLTQVMQVERTLRIEQTSPLRGPLLRFLVRFPEATLRHVFEGFSTPSDSHAHRILLNLMLMPESKPIIDYLEQNISFLVERIGLDDRESGTLFEKSTLRLLKPNGPLVRASPSYLALRLLHILFKQRHEWLHSQLASLSASGGEGEGGSLLTCATAANAPALRAVLDLWCCASFWRRHSRLTLIQLQQTQLGADFNTLLQEDDDDWMMGRVSSNSPSGSIAGVASQEALNSVRVFSGLTDISHVDEPLILLDILMACADARPTDYDLLFCLVAGMLRHRCVGYNPLPARLQCLAQTASVPWCRSVFLHFYHHYLRRRCRQQEEEGAKTKTASGATSSSFSGGRKKQLPVAQISEEPGFPAVIFGGCGDSEDILTSVQQYLITPEAQQKLLAQLILPCLKRALEVDATQLVALGQPADPERPNDSDLVHILVKLLDDEATRTCMGLRIMYYQLCCLFIYYASEYIQNNALETESYRLRAIRDFVWHCVSSNLNSVDLQEKYTGLQVLSHLVSRFPRLMGHHAMQVFICLAKGSANEAKKIVNASLDVLLPAWATGLEEQKLLALTTKKIFVDDQSAPMSVHMLGILLRNSEIFFPVRHLLINSIIAVISRLSAQQTTVDQRRVVLEMIDLIMRWDIRANANRLEAEKFQRQQSQRGESQVPQPTTSTGIALTCPSALNDPECRIFEKTQRDQMASLLIRFACQSNESNPNGLSQEASARSALALIEAAMSSEVWGGEGCELRLSFLDRFLSTDENHAPVQAQSISFAQTLMTIEVLRVLYSNLNSPTLLHGVKFFSKSFISLLVRFGTNFRLIRAWAGLFKALLTKYPAESANRQRITSYAELQDIYDSVLKFIFDALNVFAEGNVRKDGLIIKLQSAFCLLTTSQQVATNPYAFVDRNLTSLMKTFHKLVQEVTTPGGTSQQELATLNRWKIEFEKIVNTGDVAKSLLEKENELTEMTLQALELLRSRLNVINAEARKLGFGPDFMQLLERPREPRVMRAVVRCLSAWGSVPRGEEHFAPSLRERSAFFARLWTVFPRWSEAPNPNVDVYRDIFDCIYQVCSNLTVRNYDIFVKMKQAFCCAMLSPLPDVREKFLSLYLLHSDIITSVFFPELSPKTSNNSKEGGEQENPEGETPPPPTPTSPIVKCELLVRLLFLLFSMQWDESYYKDWFWLPVFFDVLLCDADFSRPSVIVQPEGRFASMQEQSDFKSDTMSGSQKTVRCEPLDGGEPMSTTTSGRDPNFEKLMQQQAAAYDNIKKLSFQETLCGFLDLVHRSPAIASEMFGQLWHCLWHRFLVREAALACPGVDNAFAASLHMPACTINGILDPRSGSERRADVLHHLRDFLASEEHVGTSDPVPSPLGFTLAGLASTSDDVLGVLPLPLMAFLGNTTQQWYNMVLLMESMCWKAQRALASETYNTAVDTEVTLEARVNEANGRPTDVPLGNAALALLSLYERRAGGGCCDLDYVVAAWWHRLSSFTTPPSQRLRGLCGNGLRFPPERITDFMTAMIRLSQGRYTLALDSFGNVLGHQSSNNGSSSSRGGDGVGVSFVPAELEVTTPGLSINGSESINRKKCVEYSMRALQQMGQWENLDSLAGLYSSSGGSSIPGGTGGSRDSGETFGISALANLVRLESSWRRKDWSEVSSLLSALTNEQPISDQWHCALLNSSICILGRRATGLHGSGDLDAGSGVQGGTSAQADSATSSASSPATSGLGQLVDAEYARSVSAILREWHRLPLHVAGGQHLRLLQACQQATEFNEGNHLLLQHVLASSPAPAPLAAPGTAQCRPPSAQYEYKAVLKTWANRCPLISDDLSFWSNLLTWRRVVLEKIISASVCTDKLNKERGNILAMCHRERAMSVVQMAKGYRKSGLPGMAQSCLNSHSYHNSNPLFEETKQEIKLKMTDRKEELLEGFELMEGTNIQHYDKKETARFFCKKAAFLALFNKGDDASKNFSFAAQIDDNLHKVWSSYGEFLDTVHTNQRTTKREKCGPSTGIYAMAALMEAATVAGSAQRQSHSDLARCIWLLSLDDVDGNGAGSNLASSTTPASTTASGSGSSSSTAAAVAGTASTAAAILQTHRLARTFEERASRVHPDAFLPWLPSLATCLLRPEGRYVASALRSIALAYPTALASVLRGLQHQLTVEVDRDRRIAAALTDLSPDQRRRLDEAYAHCVDLARRRPGDHAQTTSQPQAQPVQQRGGNTSAKRTKKRVVVVMRGAEGERLSGEVCGGSGEAGGVLAGGGGQGEVQDTEVDEEDLDPAPLGLVAAATISTDDSAEFDESAACTAFSGVAGGFMRTGYFSPSVGEGLHRIGVLFALMRQRHPARLYVSDKFVECTAGRLLPSWSENLLHHLKKALEQLHQIAWAQISRFARRPASALGPFQASIHALSAFPLPSWMAKEIMDIVACCGLPPPITASTEDLSEDQEKRSSLVFADNIQLAYTLLANEAEADPHFKHTKEALAAAITKLGSMTLLEAIGLLSKDLIPLVQRRVSRLPHTSHLTDRGAGYLIELISAINIHSIPSYISPRLFQGYSVTSAYFNNTTATACSAAMLLELPGEATRLRYIPALQNLSPFHQLNVHALQGHPQSVVNMNPSVAGGDQHSQPGMLYLADVGPTVLRVANGRRVALRATNGRLVHYDVPCLPRETPAGRGVAVAAADVMETNSMAPTLAAYEGWRETWCVPHLMHSLTDVSAKFPETAKRRITLSTPRTMDLGPHGMQLVQAGASIPATSVVAANSVAFGNPTVTGFGTLMPQQLHPSNTTATAQTNNGSAAVASGTISDVKGGGTVSSTPPSVSSLPFASDTCNFPSADAFANVLGLLPTQIPIIGTNASASGYAGTRGIAQMAAGHPVSQDSSCYSACLSVAEILDSFATTGKNRTSSLDLITAFFERLISLSSPEHKITSLKVTLVKLYEDLLQLVPRTDGSLHCPEPSKVALLSDDTGVNGTLRTWALRRMADAEAYWLLRHGVCVSYGAMALLETLFSLTPLSATGVVLDPRAGRATSRGLRFDLPPTHLPLNMPPLQQKDARSSDPIATLHRTVPHLASTFSASMAPLRPHPNSALSSSSMPASTAPGRNPSTMTQAISIPPRSVAFRLTPQISSLVCIPGVPATVGPFSAAMTTMGQAVGQRRTAVTTCLRTLLRDDFILWHRGRQAAVHASLLADLLAIENEEPLMATAGAPINVPDLSNEALVQMIIQSVDGFNNRCKALSANERSLYEIINAASLNGNLALMDPSWLPWY